MGVKNAQIELGCIVVVVIGRFSIAKLCARDGDRGTFGSSEDHDPERMAPAVPRTDRAAAPRPRRKLATIVEDPKRASGRANNFPGLTRARLRAARGRLPDCSGRSDRSVRSRQKTRVLFENMRQHRAGHQTNAMGSSHSGLNDRESDSISALSRNHSCRNHLILNGMMMSPPNVNCERFVPAPNGVVPFNEVS